MVKEMRENYHIIAELQRISLDHGDDIKERAEKILEIFFQFKPFRISNSNIRTEYDDKERFIIFTVSNLGQVEVSRDDANNMKIFDGKKSAIEGLEEVNSNISKELGDFLIIPYSQATVMMKKTHNVPYPIDSFNESVFSDAIDAEIKDYKNRLFDSIKQLLEYEFDDDVKNGVIKHNWFADIKEYTSKVNSMQENNIQRFQEKLSGLITTVNGELTIVGEEDYYKRNHPQKRPKLPNKDIIKIKVSKEPDYILATMLLDAISPEKPISLSEVLAKSHEWRRKTFDLKEKIRSSIGDADLIGMVREGADFGTLITNMIRHQFDIQPILSNDGKECIASIELKKVMLAKTKSRLQIKEVNCEVLEKLGIISPALPLLDAAMTVDKAAPFLSSDIDAIIFRWKKPQNLDPNDIRNNLAEGLHILTSHDVLASEMFSDA
jgi:hypothetical protein